jgi:ABC-type xylose transport system permease subunit
VFSFSAVVKIRTENLTAASAFTPLTTLLVQMIGSAVGLIPAYTLDPELLPSMVVVIAGVLLILYASGRR